MRQEKTLDKGDTFDAQVVPRIASYFFGGILQCPIDHRQNCRPTAIGVVYRLDSTTQELKPLPDEPWKENMHAEFAFGGAVFDRSIEISGGRSSFRLKTGEKAEFVFKTGSPEKVALYLTQVAKKKVI